MLDFIRLKPINGNTIGGIFTPFERKYTRSNSLFEDESIIAKPSQPEDQQMETILERSECCGSDDEKDIGLDSTLSLSTMGDKNKNFEEAEMSIQVDKSDIFEFYEAKEFDG